MSMIAHAILAAALLATPAKTPAPEQPATDPGLAPDPVQLQLDAAAPAQTEERSVASETAQESLPILTLADAIREADKNNTTLEEARTQLAQAQLYSRKAWAGYMPTIKLGASLTHNSDPSTTVGMQPIASSTGSLVDPFTMQPLQAVAAQVGADGTDYTMEVGQNMFAMQLSLTQALVVPQLWVAIKNTYIAERMVDLTIENARREVLFGVTQLYISAATLRETVDVRRRMLANTEDHEKDAKYRFEAGTIPKIQLVRAQIDTVNAQQQVLLAENNYTNAKLALSTLIGRNDLDFDVEKPEDVTPPDGSEDDLVKVAGDNRPDLLSARDNLTVAENTKRQSNYDYFPNLFLTANAQFARPSYKMSSAMESMMEASGGSMSEGDKWSKTWNIGLALSWTIWDGGSREVTVKENDAKVAAAEAKLRGVEAKVREEVRSAIVSLKIARSNIINAEEQLRLARENSDMVRVNFNAGVATQLDVSDANTSLIGAELNLIAQRLQAQISALTLVKAAGLFDPKPDGSDATKAQPPAEPAKEEAKPEAEAPAAAESPAAEAPAAAEPAAAAETVG